MGTGRCGQAWGRAEDVCPCVLPNPLALPWFSQGMFPDFSIVQSARLKPAKKLSQAKCAQRLVLEVEEFRPLVLEDI